MTRKEQEIFIHNKLHMTIECVKIGIRKDNNGWDHILYNVALKNTHTNDVMDVPFRTGLAHTKGPELFSVLNCIYMDSLLDEPFKYWCESLGYDDDSIKSLEIYEACKKQTEEFKRVFPDVDLSQYEEITEY